MGPVEKYEKQKSIINSADNKRAKEITAAEQSKAEQSKAEQSKAEQSKTEKSGKAEQSKTENMTEQTEKEEWAVTWGRVKISLKMKAP